MTSISVVIPLFNKEKYILRALESVLAQTVLPDEIIVVDDGSTDNGPELVQSFPDPRLKLIRQKRRRESGARNRGVAAAQGELVAFVDADDAWKPSFLEVILNLVGKYPQAGAYATAYEIVRAAGEVERPVFDVFPMGQEDGLIENYFKVAASYPFAASCIALPKKVLHEVGGFPFLEFKGIDIATWMKISLYYPIAWSSGRHAVIYMDAAGRASTRLYNHEPVTSRSARMAIEYGQVPEDMVADLREFAALTQLSAAKDCLLSGNKDRAARLLEYSKGTKLLAKTWWQLRLLAAVPGNLAPLLWKIKKFMRKYV